MSLTPWAIDEDTGDWVQLLALNGISGCGMWRIVSENHPTPGHRTAAAAHSGRFTNKRRDLGLRSGWSTVDPQVGWSALLDRQNEPRSGDPPTMMVTPKGT